MGPGQRPGRGGRPHWPTKADRACEGTVGQCGWGAKPRGRGPTSAAGGKRGFTCWPPGPPLSRQAEMGKADKLTSVSVPEMPFSRPRSGRRRRCPQDSGDLGPRKERQGGRRPTQGEGRARGGSLAQPGKVAASDPAEYSVTCLKLPATQDRSLDMSLALYAMGGLPDLGVQ